MSKRQMLGVLAATTLVAMLVGMQLSGTLVAGATHSPADKVVAAGSKLVVLGPNEEATILTATLRSSKPTDLILLVAMECSIFTRLVTGPSSDGGTDSATASGHIRAWVEIVVPVNSSSDSSQPPPEPGNDSDKVTFCNRTYSRTVTDAEDPLDGQDIEDDFIDTKNSNSFNWLRLNLGSGIHSIVVKATLLQATDGDATAEAAIGNRSLIAVPSKLANDATI